MPGIKEKKGKKEKKEKKEVVAEKVTTAKPVASKKPRERVKPGRIYLKMGSKKMEKFKCGDLVWAKMKGHPQWPAKISRVYIKAPKNKNVQFVCFFGSKNYAFIHVKHIVHHSENVLDTLIQKKNKKLQCAIGELMQELPVASLPKIKKKYESKKKIAKQEELKNDDFNGDINEETAPPKRKKKEKPVNKINGKTSAASSSKSENLEVPYLDREAGSSEDSNDFDVLENFKPQNIGFIGLDAFGKVIVEKFLKSNFDLTLFNEEEEADKFVDLGAKLANSPAEIVVNCDITFCYMDSDIFKKILTSENGILKGFEEAKNSELGPKGCVVLNIIDYETSVEINEAISIKNGLYLEAPICGTCEDVLDGKSVVVAAGDKKLFYNCKEYFNVISKKAIFVSCKIGESSKISIIFNTLNTVVKASIAEVSLLSESIGIHSMHISNIMEDTKMEIVDPVGQMKKMIDQDFQTLTPMKHIKKYMCLAMNLSNLVPHRMPITTQAKELYIRGNKSYADSDVTAIYKILKN